MKIFYTLIAAILLSFPVLSKNEPCASTPRVFTGALADHLIAGADVVREGRGTSVPSYIRFREGSEIPLNGFTEWVKNTFKLANDYDLVLYKKSRRDALGQVHYRFRETYKGIAVLGGEWIAHCKDGQVISMNGVLFDDFNLPASAGLTEVLALTSALAYIGAEQYKCNMPEEEARLKWEMHDAAATYYPKGELAYAPLNGNFNSARNFKLCWKFDIYAHKPIARKEVY
ncbi:MAG: hypothetical protein ACE5DN_05365, partial [Flavobacteriales bacterium]